ncbi:hypothetical protein A3L11_05460 [Thermococcus siculi]|uniref:Uncharacterized protein n=1 Tax=Thermococcus siculi TaxID=72803 RepID=A0A2Z2MPX2_9EURY|nr:hypothetical protein [Thermococcus siculi]ASJ08704.1 hypothetical protein A3L11_05460 [Thermococcus siculi]
MDPSGIWLITSLLAFASFLLDFKEGAETHVKLADVSLALGFLSWYFGKVYAGAVFFLTAGIAYYPELKKKWIRKRYG